MASLQAIESKFPRLRSSKKLLTLSYWKGCILRNGKAGLVRWLIWTCLFSFLVVGAQVWFFNNYRIAWDRQRIRCLPVRFLLVDLKDNTPKKDAIFAYVSKQAAPIIEDGRLVAKYIRGVPGDVVEITPKEEILVNGQLVAKGLPHLVGMAYQHKKKYFGKRVLQENEYWMMGTERLSFDSRYWGAISADQLRGRAYALF